MSKNNIYIDHPHACRFFEYQGQKWRCKSTLDKVIQCREFKIQTFLYKSGYVPKCVRYSQSGFLEENINGKVFSELGFIEDSMLLLLAEALQLIHDLDPHKYIKVFNITTLNGWCYNPFKIVSLILNNSGIERQNGFEFKNGLIKKIAYMLNKQLEEVSYAPSLIHGDVSPSNIITTVSGNIKIIDWTDCRIDIGVSDISQAIHLMQLDRNQQNILLSAYRHPLNFPFFVQFQLLMHGLYDLVAKFKNGKPYLKELELFNKRLNDILIFL